MLLHEKTEQCPAPVGTFIMTLLTPFIGLQTLEMSSRMILLKFLIINSKA
jgi:hypothetical protein